MKIIKSNAVGFEKFFKDFRTRGGSLSGSIVSAVTKIVRDVEAGGDKALFQYTAKFDGYALSADTVEVTAREKREALEQVRPEDLNVMKRAARRIKNYHRHQIVKGFSVIGEKGMTLEQRLLPLQRVGIYAPGGKAAYPSTILMAAIPAAIAGVKEIILVSPAREGKLHPLIAAAADVSGITRIFKIGGAQAVAALAYGTRTIPRVDKIVGPGNAYVAAAKKIVFGQVDIDMIAGPSEVLIIADDSAKATFAAADMLSQIEHDEMAAAVLLTPSELLAKEVAEEIDRRIKTSSRGKIMKQALRNFCAIIITQDIDQAVRLANDFAPEHLELMVRNPRNLAKKIRNAGSVFLGHFTPEALGDYMAGTNHILPTGGTARFSSPLGVYDFYKRMSVLSFSRQAFDKLRGPTARFAEMEGLDAHAESVLTRGR